MTARLSESSLNYDAQHNIILPKKCHIVNVIILHEHVDKRHSGVQLTLYSIRERYWVIN